MRNPSHIPISHTFDIHMNFLCLLKVLKHPHWHPWSCKCWRAPVSNYKLSTTFHLVWIKKVGSFYFFLNAGWIRNEIITKAVLNYTFSTIHCCFLSSSSAWIDSRTNRDVHGFLICPHWHPFPFSLLFFSRGWILRTLRVSECNRPLCLWPQTEFKWVTQCETVCIS